MNTSKQTARRVRVELFGEDVTDIMDVGVDLEWR